ncbi:hypothetical protein Tco_1259931 [Tanacetum coccineum]
MDRTEEDMKTLGFFGILKQSFKTIFSNKKIFSQITLAFLLPLTLIFIAETEISRHVFYKIENNSLPILTNGRYRNITVTDRVYYWLFQVAYLTLLTIFSLLSTATIVITIASVYTGRDVTFHHVIKIVPKIWKRLFVTFAYIYVALFLYNVVYGVLVVITRAIFGYSTLALALILVLLVLYILGFLYLSVVSQLASVVTVLENVNGFKAMKKGKNLLYGKKVVGMVIGFVMYVILVGMMIVLELFVGTRYGEYVFGIRIIWRVMIGILCGVVLLVWFLLFIVIQTVLYLVCKSFHREAIDKLSLSTFLGAYNGETIVLPNSGEEIQLGRTQVSV